MAEVRRRGGVGHRSHGGTGMRRNQKDSDPMNGFTIMVIVAVLALLFYTPFWPF